jgi:pimeloyl-ACP methyl ester carboxylesterase
METIIYFHGYGSNGSSETVKKIQKLFPNDLIISPSYCTTNADEAIQYLDTIVKSSIEKYRDIVLVGSSLGGFIANYFSNKYGIAVLLINPCLDPVVLLEKYNPKDNVNCESFKKYYLDDVFGVPKYVVLGAKDTVIPYTLFMDRFLERYEVFINNNMGHRVSSEEDIRIPINNLMYKIAL